MAGLGERAADEAHLDRAGVERLVRDHAFPGWPAPDPGVGRGRCTARHRSLRQRDFAATDPKPGRARDLDAGVSDEQGRFYQLHFLARPRESRCEAERCDRDWPHQLDGDPHDEHVLAALEPFDRTGEERRRRSAVLGVGRPWPARERSGQGEIAIEMEDRVGHGARG